MSARLKGVEEQVDAASMMVNQLEGVVGEPSGAFKKVADPSLWGTILSGHEKVRALDGRMDREMGRKEKLDAVGIKRVVSNVLGGSLKGTTLIAKVNDLDGNQGQDQLPNEY